MHVFHTVGELRAFLDQQCGKRVGLVPTMGNLHAGHCHLVELAKAQVDIVVVTIFVNPLQFGVNEDFGKYPRTLDADCAQLQVVGAHVVFAPSVEEMYPDFDGQALHQSVVVEPPAFARILCGASRPGHFAGVATVVTKLFNLVKPQLAVFGKKDYQQLLVIRALERQLNFGITIVAGETMREASGLAMSSRNGYLSVEQKLHAASLYKCLCEIGQALQEGRRDYADLQAQACQLLTQQGWQVDYVEIRSQKDLSLPAPECRQWVVLAAAKLGNTRLIDNCEVEG